MPKKYTNEELILELHRFYNENGRVPIMYEMNNKNGYPSYRAYANHFGSFNNGIETANLPLNQTSDKRTGLETCCKCNNYLKEGEDWLTKGLFKGEVMCHSCYSNIHTDYMTGNLDINTLAGRGRSGEILVLKTLNIGTEHDCNLIKWGYKVDLIHEEYGKIDVKTSLFNFENNDWAFHFNAKKVVNTYICIGFSYFGKYAQHVWIVPNIDKIRDLYTFKVYDTFRSLSNRERWEVLNKPYNDIWQEMIINYHIGECNIFK